MVSTGCSIKPSEVQFKQFSGEKVNCAVGAACPVTSTNIYRSYAHVCLALSVSYHSFDIYWYIIKQWFLKQPVIGRGLTVTTLRESLRGFGCEEKTAKCLSNDTDQLSDITESRLQPFTLEGGAPKHFRERQKHSDFIGNAIGVIKDFYCLLRILLLSSSLHFEASKNDSENVRKVVLNKILKINI